VLLKLVLLAPTLTAWAGAPVLTDVPLASKSSNATVVDAVALPSFTTSTLAMTVAAAVRTPYLLVLLVLIVLLAFHLLA
tara:strand:- start:49 stop:285 length:237 start_codon:yes stop_codon:yes gene_type:complete